MRTRAQRFFVDAGFVPFPFADFAGAGVAVGALFVGAELLGEVAFLADFAPFTTRCSFETGPYARSC